MNSTVLVSLVAAPLRERAPLDSGGRNRVRSRRCRKPGDKKKKTLGGPCGIRDGWRCLIRTPSPRELRRAFNNRHYDRHILEALTGETGAASVGKRATQAEAASSYTRGVTLLLSVQFCQGSFWT